MSDNRMIVWAIASVCLMAAIMVSAACYSDAEKERQKTELRKAMIEKGMTLEQIKEFEKVK